MDLNEYRDRVVKRSVLSFFIGIITRFPKFLKFKYSSLRLKIRRVNLGENVTILPSSLFMRNVSVGNNTSIARNLIISNNEREVRIGNNVIIGDGVRLIIESHDIDSPGWEHTCPSDPLIIEDYVWICPYSTILPSCKRIGKGAVIGACSVVTKDVGDFEVVGGNPAKAIRIRKTPHTDLVIDALLGNDLVRYIKVWFGK